MRGGTPLRPVQQRTTTAQPPIHEKTMKTDQQGRREGGWGGAEGGGRGRQAKNDKAGTLHRANVGGRIEPTLGVGLLSLIHARASATGRRPASATSTRPTHARWHAKRRAVGGHATTRVALVERRRSRRRLDHGPGGDVTEPSETGRPTGPERERTGGLCL